MVFDDLSAVREPAAVTFSGHGLQPHWPITDGAIGTDFTHGDAAALLDRWHALIVEIARRHGPTVKVDNVSDLARVMRVPGTTNRKAGMKPVKVTC